MTHNTIVTTVTALAEQIKKEGHELNGTKELLAVSPLPLVVSEMDLIAEENEVRRYYEKLGINNQAIRSLEHNLYEFIYRGLRQAVEQTLYFDKTQDYSSRRFVFSTTDCISHVQILFRPETTILAMHIRSTDVVKLLPWDMLFACKLLERILLESEFPLTKKKEVHLFIASAHYYLKPKVMY
ncbi:MAG TPA: hypothetical protein VLF60_02930 [Candidatus Saccharimonadales bacterium]|nr:hypothetical protein [Candidatus Saccharimonadales bacterium]